MGEYNERGVDPETSSLNRKFDGVDTLEESEEPGIDHKGTDTTDGFDKLDRRNSAEDSLEQSGIHFDAVDDFLGALNNLDQIEGVNGYSTLQYETSFGQKDNYDDPAMESAGVIVNEMFSSEAKRFHREIIDENLHRKITPYLGGDNGPETFLNYMENFLTEDSSGSMLQAAYLDQVEGMDEDAVTHASGVSAEDYDSIQSAVREIGAGYEKIHDIVEKTSDILYEEAAKRKEFSQNMDLPERTPDDWYGGNQKIREHI